MWRYGLLPTVRGYVAQYAAGTIRCRMSPSIPPFSFLDFQFFVAPVKQTAALLRF
jgi:hypothetical protein